MLTQTLLTVWAWGMTQTLDTFSLLQTHKSSGSQAELTVLRLCSWKPYFHAVLRSGPVAAAHKDAISPFRCVTSRRRKHGSVCAGPRKTLGVWPPAHRCLSHCCHGSKHMFFGRLPPVSVSSYWRKIWRQERGRHTAICLQWRLSSPDSVNWLAMCWKWSIDWGDGSLSSLQRSIFLSSAHRGAFNRCCMRFLNYRVWVIGNKGNVWSTVREAEPRI